MTSVEPDRDALVETALEVDEEDDQDDQLVADAEQLRDALDEEHDRLPAASALELDGA